MDRDGFAERFAKNLKGCRKRTKLSQEAVAVHAGLHRTAVGQLERGERIARTDTLVKLAGVLGVPPEDLLKGLKWSPGGVTDGEFE